MLSLLLCGDALAVLQTISMADRRDNHELLRNMEMKFCHQHLDQMYRSQFKNRVQKPNESLQEYEIDIARLVRNAYPFVDDEVYESLAVERFLDGLCEAETQRAIELAHPQTLSEALTQAFEYEAVTQSLSVHVHNQAVSVGDNHDELMEEIIKKILEKLRIEKKEIKYWGCGERGHLRSKCPKKSMFDKKQEIVDCDKDWKHCSRQK
ncbi:uncharacterized protein LOC120354506 [Nilaparvata lugens]|uniref:uncharacterized protein LOC120354506 n=1 Tax=Nilaparvata lugens TaxID=108931 RepID=UPI00193E2F9B|nr:uncharacterized protein LOC120354506 [Nilaparvata lugens]